MRTKKCCFVKIAKWWVSKILKNDGVKDRIWSEGSKLEVRGDFTSYLQDKVKKIVKKKKAISERAKLQKELDNEVMVLNFTWLYYQNLIGHIFST